MENTHIPDENELESLNFLRHKISDEGLEYTLRCYSSFKEIKNPEFRKLYDEYILVSEKIENWILSNTNEVY